MMFKRMLSLLLSTLFFGCLSKEGIDPATTDQWTYLTKKKGLSEDFVTAICEDGKGLFWFGHNNTGLTSYDGSKFTIVTSTDGLLSNTVNCMLYDSDSTFMVGTTKGLNLRLKNDKTWLYYTYLLNVPIQSIIQDKKGIHWIGTSGFGIIYLKDQVFYQLLDNNCTYCNYVNGILEASDGKVWFATAGGVKFFDGTSYSLFTVDQFKLPGKTIYSLQEDSWGNIWIGGVDGTTITRYHKGVFEKVNLTSSSNQFITSIVKGTAGELWIGSLQEGLIHYDGAVMRKIFQGPPGNNVASLFKDKSGALWVGTTNSGVARYRPK